MSRGEYGDMVESFHRKFGHKVRIRPESPTQEEVRFRMKLIAEEFLELMEAMAGSSRKMALMRESVWEFVRDVQPDMDLVHSAQEMADLIYVVEGTAVVSGVRLPPVFEEVHRANMDKEPTPGMSKPTKPVNWRPADVQAVLEDQR